jgi:hypothetical protein
MYGIVIVLAMIITLFSPRITGIQTIIDMEVKATLLLSTKEVTHLVETTRVIKMGLKRIDLRSYYKTCQTFS